MKQFLAIILFLVTSQPHQPTFVKGNNFTGYIFDAGHFVMLSIESQKSRYTPSDQDIILAEKILKQQLKTINGERHYQAGNCPIIHKKLKKYIRQYVGYKNNNDEKVIWINFLWDESNFVDRVGKDIIYVSDGCSYYWNIKVNLGTGELYELRINNYGG